MLKLYLGLFLCLFSVLGAAQYAAADEVEAVDPRDAGVVLQHPYTVQLISERNMGAVTIQRQDRDTYQVLGGSCEIVFQIQRSGGLATIDDVTLVDATCTNSSGFSVGN